MQKLWDEIQSFLIDFTGEEQIEEFFDNLKMWYTHVTEDPEVSGFFREYREYINSTLDNPQLLNDETHTNRANELWDRGNYLMDKWRYHDETDLVLNQANDILESIKEDRATRKLTDKTKKLVQDFALDSEGRPSLNVTMESLDQIRGLIIPVLTKQLEAITIPAIEASTSHYDYRIDEFMLSVKDLLPDQIKFNMYTHMDLNVKELKPNDRVALYIKLALKDFAVHVKNLKFWFHRKTTPKIEDRGTLDFDIKGRGTRIVTDWIMEVPRDKPLALKTESVDCVLDRMKIKVTEARYDWLYNMITTLFSGAIKKQLEKQIETKIRSTLEPMNEQIMNAIRTSASTVSSMTARR
jgi:hypothetical protein